MPDIQSLQSEVNRLNALVSLWNAWIIVFMVFAAGSACALVVAQRFSFRRGIEAAIAGDKLNDAKESLIKLELARQQERAAVAEKNLLEVRARQTPRNLSAPQVEKLSSLVSGKPNGPVHISCVLGDGEASGFAKQIEATLRSKGWDTGAEVGAFIWEGSEPEGVTLRIRSEFGKPPYVTRLEKALFAVGIPLNIVVSPDDNTGTPPAPYLIFGHKP